LDGENSPFKFATSGREVVLLQKVEPVGGML